MPIRLTVVLCFYMRCRFSRAYLFGRARARNYLLAAAATCEHVCRPRLGKHVAHRRCGAAEPTSAACPWPRHGGVWPGAKSTRLRLAIGRRKYFLLCELAIATSNKRQPALRPFGCLFSLSLSCYLALLLLLLYFDFQLLRKYLLFFH